MKRKRDEVASTVNLVEVMREIATSGDIEVLDQVEFNGTLYVRATEVTRLNQALDMVAEEREAWKARADELRADELRAEVERLRAALGEIVVGAETEMALYKVGFLARRALTRP